VTEMANAFTQTKKGSKTDKLEKLLDVMKLLVDEGFTGYLKVNFSQGGIGRIEKFEEILK
jgi:hypothetical protein